MLLAKFQETRGKQPEKLFSIGVERRTRRVFFPPSSTQRGTMGLAKWIVRSAVLHFFSQTLDTVTVIGPFGANSG